MRIKSFSQLFYVVNFLVLAACLQGLVFNVWPSELIVSFIWYILPFSLLSLLVFVFRRLQGDKLASDFLILISAVFLVTIAIIPLSSISSAVANKEYPDHPQIKILTHNVLYSTANSYEVSQQAMESSADIIVLVEAWPIDGQTLKNLTGFEYMYISDCGCSAKDSEAIIVSRYKITQAAFSQLTNQGGVIIDVTIDFDGRDIRVLGVHLPVPNLISTFNDRSLALDRLAGAINNSKIPTIIAGDFNTTTHSGALRGLMSMIGTNYANISDGHYPAPSWCHSLVKIGCLRIDQVIYSWEFAVEKTDILETRGSDHRAVLATFRYIDEAPQTN